MTGNEEKNKFWRIFYSPLVFIILAVVFIFMARAVWKVYGHAQVSSQDRERVEGELAVSQKRIEALKKQVDTLDTTHGVDDEIRAKFNVSKVGEGVAVIVNGTDTLSTSTVSVQDKTWWQKFLGFFGN